MSEPTPEQVTINTISDLVDRMLKFPEIYPTIDTYQEGHSAGYRHAMKDIRAILDMNGRPPGEPANIER